MKEHWSYDGNKYIDKNGERWHFVLKSVFNDNLIYENSPYEIYFRNDSRTYYGVIRFKRRKDNPYMHAKLVQKIMSDGQFREKHEEAESKSVWLKNWK